MLTSSQDPSGDDPRIIIGRRLGYVVHLTAENGRTYVALSCGDLPVHRYEYIEKSKDRNKPGTSGYAIRMVHNHIERICN